MPWVVCPGCAPRVVPLCCANAKPLKIHAAAASNATRVNCFLIMTPPYLEYPSAIGKQGAVGDGYRELSDEPRLGHQLSYGPYLDASFTRRRNLRRNLDRLVQVVRIHEVEASQLLLRFRERAISD